MIHLREAQGRSSRPGGRLAQSCRADITTRFGAMGFPWSTSTPLWMAFTLRWPALDGSIEVALTWTRRVRPDVARNRVLAVRVRVARGVLLAAVCWSIHPDAQRSIREWVNTAISIITLFVLAWTARSIVDQVTEMQRVYPEVQRQAKAMIDQTSSFIATERARVLAGPTGEVRRNGENDPMPGFPVRVMNLGPTAALVRGILIQCDINPLGLETTPSYDETQFRWTASPIMGGTVSPNALDKVCRPSQPLSQDDLAGLAGKTKIILLKGYILYQDMFGQGWKKQFGLVGQGDGKFFNVEHDDAYNAEAKVDLADSAPRPAPQ
jgi:hypothetical protein